MNKLSLEFTQDKESSSSILPRENEGPLRDMRQKARIKICSIIHVI